MDLIVQFIGWLGNFLGDFLDKVVVSIKNFIDYAWGFIHEAYAYTYAFAAWSKTVLADTWDKWTGPALEATRDALLLWSNFSGAVFKPLLAVLLEFFGQGIQTLLQINAGVTDAIGAVQGVLLTARGVVVPFVVELANYIFGGLVDAFTAHEAARARLNSLAAWTNYLVQGDGTLRDHVLFDSLANRSPAAVSVIIGTGRTGDEAAAFAQLITTFPPLTLDESLARLVPYSTAPAPAVDAGVDTLVQLVLGS